MYCLRKLSSTVFITLKHIKTRTSRREEDDISFLSTFRNNLNSFLHSCDRGRWNKSLMTCLEKYGFCFTNGHTLKAMVSQGIYESVKCIAFILSSCYEMDFTRSECSESSIERLSSRGFAIINPHFTIAS